MSIYAPKKAGPLKTLPALTSNYAAYMQTQFQLRNEVVQMEEDHSKWLDNIAILGAESVHFDMMREELFGTSFQQCGDASPSTKAERERHTPQLSARTEKLARKREERLSNSTVRRPSPMASGTNYPFKPTINQKSKEIAELQRPGDMHKRNQRYVEEKQRRIREIEDQKKMECTFQPKLNKNKRVSADEVLAQGEIPPAYQSFEIRAEMWNRDRQMRLRQAEMERMRQEEEDLQACPFQPTITRSIPTTTFRPEVSFMEQPGVDLFLDRQQRAQYEKRQKEIALENMGRPSSDSWEPRATKFKPFSFMSDSQTEQQGPVFDNPPPTAPQQASKRSARRQKQAVENPPTDEDSFEEAFEPHDVDDVGESGGEGGYGSDRATGAQPPPALTGEDFEEEHSAYDLE